MADRPSSIIMAESLIAAEDARRDLLACAGFMAEGIKSSDGHSDAMKAIVPLYLERDEVDMAAEIANTVDDPFARDRLLTMVAEKCAALDDDEYAFQLTDAIEDDGLQAQARERIALEKSAKGDFEKAGEIAAALDHPDYIYADIAIRRFAGGEEEAADEALDLIQFPAALVYALQAMALDRVRAEQWSEAAELLDDAATATAEIEHDEERIRAFADTANLFREAKRNDRSIEIFDTVKKEAENLDNIHRDFFLANAALGFLQAGSLELADRALDLINDKTQAASCLLGYAREFWEKEEKAEALEALDEAYAILRSEKETETRDSRVKNALFTSIAVQYAMFDKAERALEIAQENKNEDEQYSTLAQIAQVMELKGEDDTAHQAIKAIGDDVNRMFALVGLSGAAERAGNKEKALEILQEASTMVETIHQLSSRSGVYNELATRFAALGEAGRTREISLENLGVIEQIKDDSVRAVSLARLAGVYAEAGIEVGDEEKEILGRMAGKMEY
jgi:tetratricopeptide (TPR) repeat protein